MKGRGDRLRTRDARGQPVSMLDPYTLHLLRRYDVIPDEPLARLAADLGDGLTRLTRFFFVLGVVCTLPGIIALAIQLIRILQAGRLIWPLPWWLLLANFWVVPFVLGIAARELRERRIHSVMLHHRRCPHCGYDLRGLPRDPADRATACPECGHAWRLEAASGSE